MQERKEDEMERKYGGASSRIAMREDDVVAQERAAGTIQRTYRGHRERRQMQGLSLDPSTRWIEVSEALCFLFVKQAMAR